MSEEIDDARLAVLAFSGNVEALSTLLQRHRTALFRTAFAELQRYDDAQDAVGEAIIRVCRYAARRGAVADFAPWMHQIVRNEARRLRRRRETRRENSLGPEQALLACHRDVPGSSLTLEVKMALQRLPVEQAQVMAMYYLDGMQVSTIAVALGRPTGTVKWILSRGRANLAPLMEGYQPMKIDRKHKPQRAALAAPGLTPAYRRELAEALAAAGWDDVRIITSAPDLLAFSRPESGEFTLPSAFEGCGLVVVDERIGRASAFELLPLLAAQRRSKFALLLLLDARRSPIERDAAVLSAYISGVDFLLTKPFTTGEFVNFVTQAHQSVTAGH